MLLMKIKTCTHSVTLTCSVLFRSSGKFCKIEGWGEGVCKKYACVQGMMEGQNIRNICIRAMWMTSYYFKTYQQCNLTLTSIFLINRTKNRNFFLNAKKTQENPEKVVSLAALWNIQITGILSNITFRKYICNNYLRFSETFSCYYSYLYYYV